MTVCRYRQNNPPLTFLFGVFLKWLEKLNKIFTYIFIVPLGIFGIMHFLLPEPFHFMVPEFASKILSRNSWVIISGLILTTTASGIALNIYKIQCLYSLLLFVFIFISTVDIPSILTYKNELLFYFLVSLLKDLSLFGGTLLLLFIQKKEPLYK